MRELRCLTQNTRSIRSSKKLLALHALLLSDEQDIICLQETFLNDEIPDSLVVGGTPFRLWRRDRSGRTGGGVAVLVRQGIECSQVSVPPHLEMVVLDIRSSSRCFRLMCCYKAPNASPNYVVSLIDCLVSLCCGNSKVPILLGDFNFPKLLGCFTTSISSDKLSTSFLATVQQLSSSPIKSPSSRRGNDNILDLVFLLCRSPPTLLRSLMLRAISGHVTTFHFRSPFSSHGLPLCLNPPTEISKRVAIQRRRVFSLKWTGIFVFKILPRSTSF